ncbi:MAG: MerR family transcriptional regulator [Lactobacillus sp.]|jgi:DNA-binding transcriptional MerR regulator|nr:MerR family transcriptional regulator [Lactobacillus sp.]
MGYSIKEVAEKFGLSIYTIRYYDKQGLLPFVGRNASGYREFTESDLRFVHTICCLKDTGMKISDIKQYIDYCMAGPATIADRKRLLTAHRQQVVAQQKKLRENLQEIDYKLDVYNQPNASDIITQQRQYVSQEKQANHLPNPFQKSNS